MSDDVPTTRVDHIPPHPVADNPFVENDHEGSTAKATTEAAPKSRVKATFDIVKYIFSLGLLAFSLVVVVAAIFSKQTLATGPDYGINPIVVFLISTFAIVWLAMIEGGQGCLVGLQPVDSAIYAKSHPVSFKCIALAHKGDNLERFIVGRQFLVVLLVFVINMMVSAVDNPDVLSLKDRVTNVFLSNGVAAILTTIILGQLTAQVNAANCMLDFINNYFMLFSEYVSLAIEMSGLLHSVYLVQIIFSKIAGKPIESKEPPRSPLSNFFFWARVVMSLAILGFAFAATVIALYKGQTNMWEGVPFAVSLVALFLLMALVGIMEGMQIAFFAVMNMPEKEIAAHPIAAKNCQLISHGHNLQAFLIGRQIFVTCCMFIVARITSINVDTEDPTSSNVLGVGDGAQSFFNTGLLGAVITTIVASLIWRVIASSFPVVFLSNPLIYVIIRACMLLEESGICSAAWVLAAIHKKIVGYELDVVFLDKDAAANDDEQLDLELNKSEVEA
jgi:Silicon transporter